MLRSVTGDACRTFQPSKYQCCPHIETSQLICSANHLTGFYMMETLAFNELIQLIQSAIWRFNVTFKNLFISPRISLHGKSTYKVITNYSLK